MLRMVFLDVDRWKQLHCEPSHESKFHYYSNHNMKVSYLSLMVFTNFRIRICMKAGSLHFKQYTYSGRLYAHVDIAHLICALYPSTYI